MKILFLLIVFATRCVGQESKTLGSRTDGSDFPDGYEFRIESSDSKSRFILRHPDGNEDLVWSVPAMRFVNKGLTPSVFGAVRYVKIFGQTLSVVVSENSNWWWIRWNMKEKTRLPAIEFPFERFGMNGWELLDGNSVKVFVPAKRETALLTVDDKGVLYEDGKPWKTDGYFVFGDKWKRIHLQPSLGGEVLHHDAPTGFPYDDIARPETPMYVIDAFGDRQRWPRKPTPPNPDDAKRVGPPSRDGNRAILVHGDVLTAPVSAVNKPDEPMSPRSNWAIWASSGFVSFLFAVTGWLFMRSKWKIRKSSHGKYGSGSNS